MYVMRENNFIYFAFELFVDGYVFNRKKRKEKRNTSIFYMFRDGQNI
jgi:hypothetical protein